tara:strand:+ start:1379 stop:1555 length:177 start_codon:yes stop_codon:yes gene_type:complete
MFIKYESREVFTRMSKEKISELKSKRNTIKIMQKKKQNQNNKYKNKDLKEFKTNTYLN